MIVCERVLVMIESVRDSHLFTGKIDRFHFAFEETCALEHLPLGAVFGNLATHPETSGRLFQEDSRPISGNWDRLQVFSVETVPPSAEHSERKPTDFSRPCIDARMLSSSSMTNTVATSANAICSPLVSASTALGDVSGPHRPAVQARGSVGLSRAGCLDLRRFRVFAVALCRSKVNISKLDTARNAARSQETRSSAREKSLTVQYFPAFARYGPVFLGANHQHAHLRCRFRDLGVE